MVRYRAIFHNDDYSFNELQVATGYKRGLSKLVAKTKVFDQERLEKIQDQMHDFAEHQMKDHPEIFGDETLKPKEKGRNSDFSKEFYLRLNGCYLLHRPCIICIIIHPGVLPGYFS